jgi:type IV pilus assembly protein PilB
MTGSSVVREYGRGVSAVDVVEELVTEAYERGASDVHIVPQEHLLRVRMRLDGALRDTHTVAKDVGNEVISRIKVLSGLRIDEHNRPQDGRFRHALKYDHFVDVRVSIVPTYHGENAVMRLLSDQNERATLKTAGLSHSDREKVLRALEKPHGMLLVTGPTGSGKTTLLYSLLKLLIAPHISIVTIEDPVEYAIEGVTQIPVNARTGLTFGQGLRSILRQDPDVIMVGEIRDAETAGIAVGAALTGHRVFSTLHTNDAPGALPRLLEMGVEPYLIASTVSLVVSQRLVRRICSHCKKEKKLTKTERESLASVLPEDMSIDQLFLGEGCTLCESSGYRGRIAIHEVLELSADIRAAVLRRASTQEVREVALRQGMTALMHDGFDKVREGLTTVEEIVRLRYE